MVLQIDRSDSSIDAVTDRFVTTAALRLTIDSFLNIDILNT